MIRGIENNFLIHEGGENNLVQSCQTIQSQRYDLFGEEKYPQGRVFPSDSEILIYTQAMTLYNDFGEKILPNLEDFLAVFRRNEQISGHIMFFGLPEHYCNFKESEIIWQDSKF